MKNELVVYYSYSGNTRKGAEFISQLTGADILELKPIEDYPKDVWAAIDIFKKDVANNSRRDIKSYDLNLDEYKVVYIGTPNWGATVATPLLSFFDKEDLADKKIMPFVTHGGGGLGNCARDIVKLSKSNNYREALVYTDGRIDKRSVEQWLKVNN